MEPNLQKSANFTYSEPHEPISHHAIFTLYYSPSMSTSLKFSLPFSTFNKNITNSPPLNHVKNML
jgi:hypothetical protein